MTQGENKLKYDTFQYISVEDTLRSLMHNESYVGMIIQNNERTDDGVLREFQDAEKYRSTVTDPTKLTIWVQLFFDGMGT